MKNGSAIVTGATAGIGKANFQFPSPRLRSVFLGEISGVDAQTGLVFRSVARRLVERGYPVILACRDLSAADRVKRELLQSYPQGNIEVGPELDMARIDSVRSFVAAFGDRPLTYLINNAGVNLSRRHRTQEDLPLTIQVNYVSIYLLTRLLMKNLLKSPTRPKVINVASVMHRFGRLPSVEGLLASGDYADSKLALVMFGIEFRRRYGADVDCISVDPGAVRTKIFDAIWIGRPPWRWIIDFFFATPDDAADTILDAIDASEPFLARGTFASSLITSFPGYGDTVYGRWMYQVCGYWVLFWSILDYPLRRWLPIEKLRRTTGAPPLKLAEDPVQCRDLWSHTEIFLNLSHQDDKTLDF